MILRTRKNRISILLMIDYLCLFAAYTIAGNIRFKTMGLWPATDMYRTLLIVFLLSYCVVYLMGKESEQDATLQGHFTTFAYIMKRTFLTLCFITLYLIGVKIGNEVSRAMLGIFFFIFLILDYLMRIAFKYIVERYFSMNEYATKIMLVTTKSRAREIIYKIHQEKNTLLDFKYLTILDEDMVGETICGVPVIGNSTNITETHRFYAYDEVFIHLPYAQKYPFEKIIFGFEQMGVVTHVNIQIFNINVENKVIGSFGDYYVISYGGQSHKPILLMIKRGMDIVGSLVGLIVTGIAMIIVGPLIYIENRGPIFFSQTRVGINGRRFKIYKFRSMYMDAEEKKKELMDRNEMQGPMFKMQNDPRITKVGRFIRKTSIDELPQFYNVLKGDMSLVGTRPPTEDEYEKYQGYHMRRLSIKPGITGLWQVNGRNKITDFEEVVKLDLKYIDQWSLLMDVGVLLKTIRAVMRGV
ncbi:MAG: sugar transferase [Lachnospiraceae bacterium]|nr:sugar transferase [Lachnospiraceae bacterium]